MRGTNKSNSKKVMSDHHQITTKPIIHAEPDTEPGKQPNATTMTRQSVTQDEPKTAHQQQPHDDEKPLPTPPRDARPKTYDVRPKTSSKPNSNSSSSSDFQMVYSQKRGIMAYCDDSSDSTDDGDLDLSAKVKPTTTAARTLRKTRSRGKGKGERHDLSDVRGSFGLDECGGISNSAFMDECHL